jgi:predicted O-methyltransferase YrrM
VPDTNLVLGADAARIWPPTPREIAGIDWRAAEQVALARGVFAEQERLEFGPGSAGSPPRYSPDNELYPPLDAWVLEAMLRHHRPSRVIEMGSGHSTLVTAQVIREHLPGCDLRCVEPYPPPYLSDVPEIAELVPRRVQEVPLDWFATLDAGDVLFIDTSHTVKTGNDVLWIYEEIVPRVRPGVVIHVHDIFLPFDYPRAWLEEGRGWAEQYLLRAFLAFNPAFPVEFATVWMLHHHPEVIAAAFPGHAAQASQGAGSIWFRRAG